MDLRGADAWDSAAQFSLSISRMYFPRSSDLFTTTKFLIPRHLSGARWISVFAALASLHSAWLSAEVISRTEVVTGSGPVGLGTITFPQFNPTVGHLDSVTLNLDPVTRIDATATGMNPSDTPDQVSVDFQASIRLNDVSQQAATVLFGSTTFSVAPQSSEAGMISATGNGASQIEIDADALQRWTGNGNMTVNWEVTDATPIVRASSSTVEVRVDTYFISATLLFNYTGASLTNLLQYDLTDGTFHFIQNQQPAIIEFRPDFGIATAWTTHYESGTNSPGTLVRLLLTGNSGFYRVRFPSNPSSYTEVLNVPEGTRGEGTYIVFRGLKSSNIVLEGTSAAPQGSGSPARAPINAVQLVPAAASATSISIKKTATGIEITYQGTLQSAATLSGTFSDVAGATSPYSTTATDAARFFKAK